MDTKMWKVLLAVIVVTTLSLAFAGCGGNSPDKVDAAAETPVEAEPEVVEQEVSKQIAEAANTATTGDIYSGSWIGVDDSSLFVNITKDGDKYQYEDNDGKYEAVFENGILKITVAENDYANVYVEKDTGNLVLTYQDNVVKYKKK